MRKSASNFIRLFTLIFIHLKSYAQSDTILINVESPDIKRLEWITFDNVNRLRHDKKLQNLIWDNVLYRAAKDHADYLIKGKELTHSQESIEKKTPFNRVKIHGGIDYNIVGENLVSVNLGVELSLNGTIFNTSSYNSSGQTLAILWKSSSGHYKNIISEKFKYSALAVSYDKITHRLIAVQVFGFSNTPPSLVPPPDYSEQLLKAPKQKLPYGLKKYTFTNKNKYSTEGFLNLEIDRGYLTGKYKNAKKIFRGRKSGIAQEFIPISDYDSTSVNFSMVPNRRNGVFQLNGNLSKPVYRKELLKFSRLFTERSYIINTRWIKIKKPPKYFAYPLLPNSSEKEYNLFLIKNKKLVIHRTYMMVPSQLFDTSFPKLDFTSEFSNYKPQAKFKMYSTYDTLKLTVFYSAGETGIDSVKQFEIINRINSIQGKVIAFKASAYASIEGILQKNQDLAKKRMTQFISVAKPHLDKVKFKNKLSTGENWELFYQQIKGTPLESLSKMSKNEIRNYINEHKSDTTIRKLLNEQRHMEFFLISVTDHKVPIKSNHNPVQAYDSLLTLTYSSVKPKAELFKATEQAQLAYYHYLSQKDTVLSSSVIPFPKWEKHPEFEYHDLIFRYLVLKNLTDFEFYNSLHDIGFSRYFPSRLKDQLIFNNLLLIYNNFQHGKLDSLIDDVTCNPIRQRDFYFKSYPFIKCKPNNKNETFWTLSELPIFINLQKKIYNNKYTSDLWKYYYLYTIISLTDRIPLDPDINRYIAGFKKCFHPNDSILNDDERLKYAYFYCAIKNYQAAKKLIEPIAIRDNPNIEGLKLYVTLIYTEFEQLHDFANYLITQFPRLGKNEWCNLWKNPYYLNALLLENLNLKKFYNCNCGK